mmetsp:Transcript_126140/g.200054  ORF Transcript_126140/g.200054 Transcript_126140/m.200054 type:complete len:328 (+) Transcript_126140:74-1057(+)
MSKRGTTPQVCAAAVVTLGYAAFSTASSNESVLDLLPKGSKIRRLVEQYRDACSKSPRLSAIRALSTAMVFLWAQSVRLHNVSIVDIFWSLSFLVSNLAYNSHAHASKAFTGRAMLVTGLTTAWAARLSSYLWWRNHVSGHGVGEGGSLEDFRYQVFRRHWDRRGLSYWWFSLFQVFGLQGVLSFVVGAPLHAAATLRQPQHFTFFDFVGALTWAAGYVFEHAGDLEVTAFKSDPSNKGQILTKGLWAYTRHPNYFGNALMWWGIWLVACATEGGWRSFYGPALMNYLLTNVSGAKLLEKSLKRSKPGFASYQKSVPEFVPWGLLGV